MKPSWGITVSGQRGNLIRMVMLALLIVGLSLVTLDGGEPERASTDLPDEPPDPVEVKPPQQGLWADDEPPPRSTPRQGAREQIPRPNAEPGLEPSSSEAPPQEPGDARVSPRVEPEAIKTAIDEVLPEIEECLHGWWMLQPELSGKVVVEFELGPEGLSDVFVLDHDGVPGGVLSCFGTALYEADFPAGPEEGMVVQYPFVFGGSESPEDSG